MKILFKIKNFLFILLGATLLLVTCRGDNFDDVVPDSVEALIKSFQIAGKTATIDHQTGTITMTLNSGTDLTKLSPTITLVPGATVTPNSGTVQDFSKGTVIYTVKGNNGATKEYKANVVAYGDPKFLTFTIAGKAGVIDNTTGTINIEIGSADGSVTALTPQFTTALGTTVDVASGVERDFSQPVKYTITSNDGYTSKDYYVNVTQIETPKITAFTINGVTGAINQAARTISIELPQGVDIATLTPIITTGKNQTVSPASGTVQNFKSPVVYTVTNSEKLTKTYTVTVTTSQFTGTKYAFFGEQSSVDNLADDDAKAAAQWMRTNYGSDFIYIPFSQINAANLADVKVAMLYYLTPKENLGYSASSTDVSTMLPSGLRKGGSQAEALKVWVKSGGRLLLAGDPNPLIFSIGRVPADFSAARVPGNYVYSEFGNGGLETNHTSDDIWGLGVRPSNTASNVQNHPIFKNLTITNGEYLGLNNAASREVRLVWWQHMDGILNPSCCGVAAAVKFEKILNTQKFGTLRHIGDTFGYGAVLWKRTDSNTDPSMDSNIPTDFKGSIFTLENTIIGYEWDSNGTHNDYQDNIRIFTKNILDYLYQL